MQERILLVRRDNIGDLVLTTPLIAALRASRPGAWIGFLANSYNAPVLKGNPHLDAVFTYDKAKHRSDKSRLSVYLDTLRTIWHLRALKIDVAILAGPGEQRRAYDLVRWIRPVRTIGFVTCKFAPAGINVPVRADGAETLSETEDVFRLLAPLGISGPIPVCRVQSDAVQTAALKGKVYPSLRAARPPWVGVQISARRPKQRWPLERFAELMKNIYARSGNGFLLFWAPGDASDPRHPGDDANARALLALLPSGFPVYAHASTSLESLVAGLALVDVVVTPDGGAMHLAAGLGKPVLALFGDSPVGRWRPWGVRYEVAQGGEGDLRNLSTQDAYDAWERLTAGFDAAR